MDTTPIQTQIFAAIKASLPPHLSLADEIADTLEISNDSAYRRIRGEKPITLDELVRLSKKFTFSIDRTLSLENESYIFTGKLANAKSFILPLWLANSLKQFQTMANYPQGHVYYLAKDIPVPHFFHVPELACFKFFFWQKSILLHDELKGVKFKLQPMDNDDVVVARKMVETYNRLSTSEMWATETVNSALRQIQYYYEAGIFESKNTAGDLCNAFEQLLNHLEKQAEYGVKFSYGKAPMPDSGAYLLYNNELIVGNNHVIADLGEVKLSYLNHSSINYVSTSDPVFNEYHLNAAKNMINKSEPLHTSNEKRRSAFFNKLRQKIEATRRNTS